MLELWLQLRYAFADHGICCSQIAWSIALLQICHQRCCVCGFKHHGAAGVCS